MAYSSDISNTVSISTDLNVDPYYDDFNEESNFHQILFRPGLAVQARELTQLQTLLQKQTSQTNTSNRRGFKHLFDHSQ